MLKLALSAVLVRSMGAAVVVSKNASQITVALCTETMVPYFFPSRAWSV